MKAINRSNYEEFFFLYVDNELDGKRREEVERFVDENADLSVELDMLMQTRVMPDNGVVFTNKDNLIRTEGDGINETNYEEYFLLYIDNELSSSKKQEVETYILQHPRLQDEFTLLKQAVLQTEVVRYHNKEELYRREPQRVIRLKLWRMAAAAVFIGVCAVGWWMMERSSSATPVADVPKTSQEPGKKTDQPKPVIEQPKSAQNDVSNQQTVSIDKKVEPIARTEKRETVTEKNEKETASNKQVRSQNNKAPDERLAKTEQPDIITHDIVKEPVIDHTNQVVTELPQVAQKTEPESNDNASYNVYPVAYKVIDPNDDDQSVHVAMMDLNKNKVKSFFRKAGRLFNNKSSDLANEDGKLQVANFEIETNKQ